MSNTEEEKNEEAVASQTEDQEQQGNSDNDFKKKMEESLENLQNSNFIIYFYVPPLNEPSGGVGVIWRFVRELKDNGYEAKIIFEPGVDQQASLQESKKAGKQVEVYSKPDPKWMEFDISDIDTIPLGDKKIKFNDGTTQECKPLQVNPEDILVIPEGFPDVMEKTYQISCKRVVLAQSWMYVLSSMNAGQKWQHFGIKDVISVSDFITEYLNVIMPGLEIKNIKQGIDRNLFYPPKKISEKYPMVAFIPGRGGESQLKTYNIIKNFYSFYPHLQFVRFFEMSNMNKEEFAERLRNCAFALYTDDIAGFGTFPLEAMACGTHVVGWSPYGGKEYINEKNGYWCNNGEIFQVAEMLGIVVDKWLKGELDNESIQNDYEETLKNYTMENEKTRLLNIIEEYKEERVSELEQAKR